MSSEEFDKLSVKEKELYISCLKHTRDFLYWVGQRQAAGDDVNGLIGWFEFLKDNPGFYETNNDND